MLRDNTNIIENIATRDHTENMINFLVEILK
jgi:hypothetical protein